MPDEDEASAAFEAGLIKAIVACGVDSAYVSLCYESYLQDYGLVISEGPLSAECIARVDAAVNHAAILSFTDPSNSAELLRMQTQQARQMLREKAESMPGLPRFDPAAMTLEAFARELEAYCGVEPGTGIEVRDGKLLVLLPTLPLQPGGMQHAGRLMEAMSVSLVDHDGLRAGIIGGT